MDELEREEEYSTQRYVIYGDKGKKQKAFFSEPVKKRHPLSNQQGYEFFVYSPCGHECMCWRACTKAEAVARAEQLIERLGFFKVPPRVISV